MRHRQHNFDFCRHRASARRWQVCRSPPSARLRPTHPGSLQRGKGGGMRPHCCFTLLCLSANCEIDSQLKVRIRKLQFENVNVVSAIVNVCLGHFCSLEGSPQSLALISANNISLRRALTYDILEHSSDLQRRHGVFGPQG